MTPERIRNFVTESMAVSNVNDPVSLLSDVAQHVKLLGEPALNANVLAGFARAIDPKADFIKSDKHSAALDDILQKMVVGMGAMAVSDKERGAEKAPEGGAILLRKRPRAEARDWLAYLTYRAFMELAPFVHPAMNGIVGRAVWFWIMDADTDGKTFLHRWHDQSLQFGGVAVVEKGTVSVVG